jgi:hypothetical protein
MVKYPFTHIVLGLILLISVAFNAFCVANYWQIKPNWMICPIESSGSGVSEAQEAFFGKVIGFYETLIYYQFGIIGILLVVCFLYTNVVSKRQAREIIDEEMYSHHFDKFFGDKIRELGKSTLIELLNNEDVINRLTDVEGKVSKISKSVPRPKQNTTTIKKKSTNSSRNRKKTNGNDS